MLATAKIATFKGPTRLALHSVEGFGKTTLASFFPKPLFVCGERGFPRDLGHAPSYVEPQSWKDVQTLINELLTQQHDYQSLVFDTMDWIEPLIWRHLLERDSNEKTELNPTGKKLTSIESYGYGKGYINSMEQMRELLIALDHLQTRRGMHIVILMHSQVKKFDNPSGDNFDRWVPKMHERCSRLVIEWCENVLFGYFEIATHKDDIKDRKAKGTSTGRRILGTRHNAMYDAKNRFNLPDTVELGDPRQLIPYLLGQHIATPDMSANAASPSGKQPEPEKPVESGPPLNMTSKLSEQPKQDATKGQTFEQTQSQLAAAYEQQAKSTTQLSTETSDQMKAIESMLADLERACGPKQRKDMEKWLSAADDQKKLDWCFAEATKLIAAAGAKTATA